MMEITMVNHPPYKNLVSIEREREPHMFFQNLIQSFVIPSSRHLTLSLVKLVRGSDNNPLQVWLEIFNFDTLFPPTYQA